MTQDEMIEMARQAQMPFYRRTGEITYLDKLEAFANLVAQHEREKSLKLWMLLDDIDTADDIAKTDHDTYRRLCRNTQQKRWAVLSESEVDAAIRARGQA
jgi:capsule polysaccharide modification protein KpsS